MNMVKGKCRNCGGDYGIHHYLTDQCPFGGREAPINKKQEYMESTYKEEKLSDEEIAELFENLSIPVDGENMWFMYNTVQTWYDKVSHR